MNIRPLRHRRGQGDEGAILVLVAAGMVLLCVLVAFAVDLGQARFSKRDSQQAVDLASLAAGFYLAGNGSDPVVSSPRKACGGAIDSVRTNVEDFTGLTDAAISAACAGYPATATGCSSYTDVVVSEGRYTLTVHYPVLDSELTDARFAGAGVADGSDKCERMQISLVKTDDTGFASIIGIDEIETNASSIVRGRTLPPDVAPAFLMLERTDCGVLGNSSNGTDSDSGLPNLGIVVENNGDDPGIIHSDSNATTNCKDGKTPDAYAIYGTTRSGGLPSIDAQDGAGGASGIISTPAINGKGAGDFEGGGLSVAPTEGDIYSRKIVDDKYNSGDSTAVTDLHLEAAAAVGETGTPADSATMSCDGDVTQVDPPSTVLFVDCATFKRSEAFDDFTEVIFSDKVNLNPSFELSFPDAVAVVIRGQLAVAKGRFVAPNVAKLYVGGGVSIEKNGKLAVNSTTESSCNSSGSSSTAFAIFGGDPAFDSSGAASLCATTMYLGGPKSMTTYRIQQTENGGTCSGQLPCPKVSGNEATGARAKFDGGGTTTWSAPNQYLSAVPAGTKQGREDLALWMEGSGTSEIKGGAKIHVTGVLFGPNADWQIQSPASGLPRDAQFIARTLFLNQGTLRMQPTKANSILIPVVGSYSLIR